MLHCQWISGQIAATPAGTYEVMAEEVWGIDKFETLYFSTEEQSFLKQSRDTTITYANFQLGKIASANTFNPLKINLFYKDFNTVVILDNRLAEVKKLDFNTIQPYRNITFASTGHDNTLWLYNQDLQLLELFDYRSNTSRIKTVPIQDEVLDLKSDYNNCYLLTTQYLYVYSYFGNLEAKYPNDKGYLKMAFGNTQLVLLGDNNYHLYNQQDADITAIEGCDFLSDEFLVTNETLYLYRDNRLYRYQLKTN